MTTLTAHPDAGALVRLVDDALEDDERVIILAHVHGCPACTRRTADLRLCSEGLSRVLTMTDPLRLRDVRAMPVSAARPVRERRWLRAAILVLALGVAALGAPPVRAWLAAGWAALAGARDEPPAALPAPAAAPGRSAIAFAFADTVFVLTFDARQRAGALTILFVDEAGPVHARATSAAAELLVTPDGMRIVNSPAQAGSYHVALPASVRAVRLRIAGDERVLHARAGERFRVIELSQQMPRRE